MPVDVADDGPRPGLLSVQATAKLMGCSDSTVWRMIKAGQLAGVQHNRKSWISRTEIADYWARLDAEAAKRRAQSAKGARGGRRPNLKAVSG